MMTPTETLKKIEGVFSKVGITRVANITHFDHFYGVYVCNCIRPNSKNLSVSQGKGQSLELAMISAIMESLEGYHVEESLPSKMVGTFQGNQGADIISPNVFCTTAFRADLENISFKWSFATNLLGGQEMLIPSALACVNTTIPNMDYLYFNVSSNGLAAGNSKNEALCHAIFEIIERDALWKWQQKSSESKNADVISSQMIDELNSPVIAKLKFHGLSLRIWSITSNLAIPAYHVAIIDEQSLRGLNVFTGTGAHFSKSIALYRAISEAIQGRLTYIAGVRDDVFEDYYKKMRVNHAHFLPKHVGVEGKSFVNELTRPLFGADENLQTLLAMLKSNNYDKVLLVDHTREELSIPVVQVFIPGMQLNNARM
jgi:ribosomal protein S12 methylthiotransferase accessory factor